MYSMKRASELLGIPVVTIRAWENRYGVISPNRSSGGHRLLSEEDLAKLSFLKDQIQKNGLKISEAARLLQQSESVPAEPDQEQAPKRPISGRSYDGLVDKLYTDLISFNALQADKTIDLAFALYDFEETFRCILVPVLYRIGAEWEAGKIAVVQEHFASETIMRRLSALYRVYPVDPDLPAVLAFCPEGERHHLGLLSFSLFLRKRGVNVLYAGPDTPFQDLEAIIGGQNISFVAISVTDTRYIDKLMEWIETAARHNPQLRFLLGGAAFDGQAARRKVKANVRYLSADEWEDWHHA
ncbi:B12 binding domain-containing protein [Paenibacillus sp. UNCCL117]|uniref:MerR family transcriptional regulator n=1 Tax=unclassified Paenibacillus TaxID=185978 RepID=UPI00088C095F|nr:MULTISPECIES: MerR family transcriptional regulator [unclassified Paenibacillus]SDD83380.1 B12 binding domain-containing protein [Paenibacillus sp. cl123]SFW54883.1 B12 binding domain-containing protein [Paenibacillus sp. UNCCL117]